MYRLEIYWHGSTLTNCLLKIACNNVNTDDRNFFFLLLETKIYSWSTIAKFSPLFYESKKWLPVCPPFFCEFQYKNVQWNFITIINIILALSLFFSISTKKNVHWQLKNVYIAKEFLSSFAIYFCNFLVVVFNSNNL